MRLKVTHRTEYTYDVPVRYALQKLRLIPYNNATQTVRSWQLSTKGVKEQVRFTDQFVNETLLVSIEGEPRMIVLEAKGEVETHDTAGIIGKHRGFAPLWLFEQETPLTAVGEGIRNLTNGLSERSQLGKLHELMTAIRAKVQYRPGATTPSTTAEDALAAQAGVCQDHAHIFIAAVRVLGLPARYVSGYLMMNDDPEQTASHAWAEAHVRDLGWVGFDVSNCISPDERYVRLATGRDYRDAAPVSGIRLGTAEERLAVHITVEQ